LVAVFEFYGKNTKLKMIGDEKNESRVFYPALTGSNPPPQD